MSTMRGLIVNVADEKHDKWVDSPLQPCFYLPDGTPVFEVWFWHRTQGRWFVMTTADPAGWAAQGVVAFLPGTKPET